MWTYRYYTLLAYNIRFEYFNQNYCFSHSKPLNYYHPIYHSEDLFSRHSRIIYVLLQGRIIFLGHFLKLLSLLLCFFLPTYQIPVHHHEVPHTLIYFEYRDSWIPFYFGVNESLLTGLISIVMSSFGQSRFPCKLFIRL